MQYNDECLLVLEPMTAMHEQQLLSTAPQAKPCAPPQRKPVRGGLNDIFRLRFAPTSFVPLRESFFNVVPLFLSSDASRIEL
jgi:hypothetical protein